MRDSTLNALCEKYGIDRAAIPSMNVPKTFSSFDDFEDSVVATCFDTIRESEDIERIIMEMAEDAAADGVVYIEPAFGAAGIFAHRWPMPSERAVWDVVLLAGKKAEAKTGVVIRWMVPAVRTLGAEAAMFQAQLAVDMAQAGEPVVAFGLHASEGCKLNGDGPFPPEIFEDAFRLAASAGLVSTPHAGEFLGAASCRGAVERLGAARLLHGVRAMEGKDTLDLLNRCRVCCDVCPTSNVLLQVVPCLEEHPLPGLLKAGVPCSINVDDSLLFGKSINEEYTTARDILGLSNEDLRCCARNSLLFSSLLLRAKRGFPDSAVATIEAQLKIVDLWGQQESVGSCNGDTTPTAPPLGQ